MLILQRIDLSENMVNDDILTTLCNMMRYSGFLYDINLSANELTFEK